MGHKKLVNLSKLKRLQWRGKRVVLIGGTFDILHQGHIDHLKSAKSHGDVLVVHITGDRRFQEKKKRRPVFFERDRAKLISAIEYVDYVFIYNGRHFDQKIINAVRPSVLFFGNEAFNDEVREYIKKHLKFSGKIIVDKLPKINSSSSIIKIIKNRS